MALIAHNASVLGTRKVASVARPQRVPLAACRITRTAPRHNVTGGLLQLGNRNTCGLRTGAHAGRAKGVVTKASAEPIETTPKTRSTAQNTNANANNGLGLMTGLFDFGGSTRTGVKKSPLNGDGTSDWLTAEELEILNQQGGAQRDPRQIGDGESNRKWRGNYGLFALVLFFIPLAVSSLVRVLIIEPSMTWHSTHHAEAFAMSKHQKAAAYEEIVGEEKETQFDVILGKESLQEQPREAMKMRAEQLEAKERAKNKKALENLLTDATFFVTLACILVLNPTKVSALKNRLSDKFYGMPSATQAFAMLLIADILVGYHSSDGWITVVALVSEHYGFRESEVFVSVFVATVPVTLDVIFKYWVFRFLRQSNPSTGIILEDIDRH